MSHTIGNITFGKIKNVRKSGDEEGVFFADVEISENNNQFEFHLYCARSNDLAETGIWVYNQIISGNFEGEMKFLVSGANPETGELPTFEEKSNIVRAHRDQLLKESDWTQLPDIPQETKDLWFSYRQALRDITLQDQFPDSVTWPNKPM